MVMIDTKTHQRRSLHPRLHLSLLLLGILGLVLVLLVPTFVAAPHGSSGTSLGAPDCIANTPEGDVGLDRDEAQVATTAVALRARGMDGPDTSGIDEAVLQHLAQGPSAGAGPNLSCQGSAASDLPEQQLTGSGLTPRAEQLRAAMTEIFGEQSLGGFAPGGVGQGHGADSTHYDGRAIDIFFRPVTEENRREGWMLAQWLVAHAEALNIQYVIFDDLFWSAHLPQGAWHRYDAPEPSNEILRHLDHVHVDVLRGGDAP